MGYETKHRILQKGDTKCKFKLHWDFILPQIAWQRFLFFKGTTNNGGCWEKEIFIHCWWEWNLRQILLKSAWVIKMLEMYLLYTTLKHRPKRWCPTAKALVHPCLLCSVHKSQVRKVAYMSINWWVDSGNMIHLNSRILKVSSWN